MSQKELIEIRENFAKMNLGNQNVQNANPEDVLSKNLFSMDEKGNIVNFVLSPPLPLYNKEQFIEAISHLSQNKIMQVMLKQLN